MSGIEWTPRYITHGFVSTEEWEASRPRVTTPFRDAMKIKADIEFGPGIQTLIDVAVKVDAQRRADAIKEAHSAGVGLRVDCYPYRTEYWLDVRVPVGEIHEHECVEP